MILDILYGTWSYDHIARLKNFTSTIGKSKWYKTATKYFYQHHTYPDRRKTATKEIEFGNAVIDTYSKGKYLSGIAIPEIIEKQIRSKALPVSTSAIYAFLVSLTRLSYWQLC
jgi:hypothetical protein